MKIAILDGYTENPGDLSWTPFEELGELTVYERTASAQAAARIGNAEIVLVNKTLLPAEVFDMCPKLRYVGVLATGYNVVDTVAAREHGVPVCNIPAYGTEAVAQFAIALLLEICCRVGLHDASVHAGDWTEAPDWCYWKAPLIELCGKTMGIVGYGRIGRATGRIAQSLGMSVLACDAHEDPSLTGPAMRYAPLDEVFANADVLALHCPLLPETEGLVCRETIARMKDGVIILNNSRGGLIVEEDLAAALRSGKVYAAGLDVAGSEPISRDSPLLTAPGCILTPHISWAPRETRQRLMEIAAENLRCFLAGNPINVVN